MGPDLERRNRFRRAYGRNRDRDRFLHGHRRRDWNRPFAAAATTAPAAGARAGSGFLGLLLSSLTACARGERRREHQRERGYGMLPTTRQPLQNGKYHD